MIYNLAISDKRKIQWASPVSLPTPRLHEKRNLKVHDFIYMIKGSWEISLGKETYLMKPDSVLFLPAGITHQGVSPCAVNTEIIYLHIYPTDEDGVVNSLKTQDKSVTIKNFLSTEERPIIKKLFQRLPQLTNDPTLFLAYTNVLLCELGALSLSATTLSAAEQIKEFLLSSPQTPSNKDVAEHFHVSLKTAENIFHTAYQMPMHQFVIRHKLERAKQYLADFPETSLCELAQILNFYDEHHLSRSFKKNFGVSPREYKKLILNNKAK